MEIIFYVIMVYYKLTLTYLNVILVTEGITVNFPPVFFIFAGFYISLDEGDSYSITSSLTMLSLLRPRWDLTVTLLVGSLGEDCFGMGLM